MQMHAIRSFSHRTDKPNTRSPFPARLFDRLQVLMLCMTTLKRTEYCYTLQDTYAKGAEQYMLGQVHEEMPE
jgi:hypothetical protein